MASAKRGTVLLPALTQTLNIPQAAYARRFLSAGRVGIPETPPLHHACTIRPLPLPTRIGLDVHMPPGQSMGYQRGYMFCFKAK